MDEDVQAPELFVARDRARRFARYIREALQERKLYYRGADVGMASLVDEAEQALTAVIEDARQTVEDVLSHRIRDRERGYMELPLVTAVEGLLDRLVLARALVRAQSAVGSAGPEERAAVLALLDEALLRIDAYCGAYDEKRPAGPARGTDVAHLLEQIEREVHWGRLMLDPRTKPAPAYDRPPPNVKSDSNALADVLRAVRAAGQPGPETWRVVPGAPGRPLELAVGARGPAAEPVPVPERLARALEVLNLAGPATAVCHGTRAGEGRALLSEAGAGEPVITEVVLHLEDEAAGRVELSVAASAGPEAALDPEHEKAVRALVQAPPLPDEGPPPPQRLVALMGVLRAVDDALARRVLPRARTNAVRVAASRLPRETTRKAPLKSGLVEDLASRFPELPAHRLEDVAQAAADGKLAARAAVPADMAALLALLGGTWPAGGHTLHRAVDLDPLPEAEVEALVRALCEVASIRRDLEGGRTVEAVRMRRIEQSSIAVLGLLGRLS